MGSIWNILFSWHEEHKRCLCNFICIWIIRSAILSTTQVLKMHRIDPKKKKVLQTTEFRYKILLREISCQFCNTSFLFENPTLLMHFFWFSRRVDIWPRLYLWLVPHHTQFCDFLPRRWHIHQHCIFHSIKLLNDLKPFFFFFFKVECGNFNWSLFYLSFHSISFALLNTRYVL